MMYPVIRLLSLLGLGISAVSLFWYENLCEEQQEIADRKAADYAGRVYKKSLEELSAPELRQVIGHVKGHFAG